MTRLNIEISDDVRSTLQERAAQSGFPSLEAYVESLLRDDAQLIDFGSPDSFHVRSRQQLEALLVEGAQSPAREMTPADWQRMREDLIQQHRRHIKAG